MECTVSCQGSALARSDSARLSRRAARADAVVQRPRSPPRTRGCRPEPRCVPIQEFPDIPQPPGVGFGNVRLEIPVERHGLQQCGRRPAPPFDRIASTQFRERCRAPQRVESGGAQHG